MAPEVSAGPDDATRIHPLAPLLAWIARVVSGVQVRWLDCEPSAAQRIYFANHTSHLDAAVLWAALHEQSPIPVKLVAAKDYWESTRLRRYISSRVFPVILVERRSPNMGPSRIQAQATIDRMTSAMGDRVSLIVFPEGTRGTGNDIGLFKSGLFHLAIQKPEVELVPCFMENLNRILPKGEVLPVPFLSSLTFGPPMRVDPGEGKKIFLGRAREALRRLKCS